MISSWVRASSSPTAGKPRSRAFRDCGGSTAASTERSTTPVIDVLDHRGRHAEPHPGAAEREGFEPPDPCGSVAFKATAIDRTLPPLLGQATLRGSDIRRNGGCC